MKPTLVLKMTISPGGVVSKKYKHNNTSLWVGFQKMLLNVASSAYFFAHEDNLKPGIYKFRIGYCWVIPVYYTVLYKEMSNEG